VSTSSIVVRADYTAAVKAKMHEAGGAALKEAADELLSVASETVPVAPVGGGLLRDSGKAEVDEAGLCAQVGYTTGPSGRPGGGSIAVVVHEDTTASHHGGGHAKWLEMAAKETAKRLGIAIGVSIKGRMG